MSKPEQKWALLEVYGWKCAYCGRPLPFMDAQVDHILPQTLLTKPAKLEAIALEYGLGAHFSIEDYCNWVPACPRCNATKGAMILAKGRALVLLERAISKADAARDEEARIVRNQKKGKVFARLAVALETGLVAADEIISYLKSAELDAAIRQAGFDEGGYDPVVVTFGLNVFDLHDLADKGKLPRHVPIISPYAALCDWLEADLLERLQRGLTCQFFHTEVSSRNGETLSVRLSFAGLDLDQFSKLELAWWEVLEVALFSYTYGVLDGDDFLPRIGSY